MDPSRLIGGFWSLQDSLQAFCSSIAGLLSSRAVLQGLHLILHSQNRPDHRTGVGVGNADASPTSALLLHILQDSSGRIATILFAHRVGTALEPECKTYRLAADVFNDIAMILDCLSPMVPGGVMRVSVLSTAGVLRALCGVAGGSSKASLSAHFAKWGNLAELNAVSQQPHLRTDEIVLNVRTERLFSRDCNFPCRHAGKPPLHGFARSIGVLPLSRLAPSSSPASAGSPPHG